MPSKPLSNLKTYMLLEPDRKRGVVVMCNAARGQPASIATTILDQLVSAGERRDPLSK